MSLRILFADDSMTAQNMGKKILTDAGYEVVAVSNGAAAVKKIKEQKPDIIILDIYMPGYTGLEVCDKVRTSHDTLRTPVLLTVGKMEPYRPEDANRVRADGVIIKPFEASDLLAVIKKLEERVVKKSVPVGEQTILLERPPDFTEFDVPAPENHHEVHADSSHATVQSTVDVPDNMATTAAFSDLLGTDTAHSLEPLPLPSQAFSTELPVPPTIELEPATPSVAQENPAATAKQESATELHAVVPEEKSEPAEVKLESFAAAIPDTEPIPVYREPDLIVTEVAPPEPEKPAAAASAESETPETHKAAETSTSIDPGLEIHVAKFEPFTAKVDAELEKIEAIVAASESRHVEEPKAGSQNGFAPASIEVPSSSDADFEARVAAAMSVYDQPVEHAAAETEIAREPETAEQPASFEYSPPVNAAAVEIPVEAPAAEKTEAAAVETAHATSDAPAVTPPVAETTEPPIEAPISVGPMLVTSEVTQVIPVYLEPKVEPEQTAAAVEAPISAGPMFISTEATQVIPVYLEPPAETPGPEPVAEAPISAAPTFISTEATQVIPVYLEAPTEQAKSEPRSVAEVPVEVQQETGAIEEKVAAEVKAELPNLAEDASGLDTIMISAVADRILDRLKPQLIEEIARELKKKKQ